MKLLQNRFDNAVDVREYVMIPEANDAKAKLFDFCGSRFVSRDSFSVLSTVEFDHQSRFERCEIGDVPANRDLSSKFVAIETPPAQMPPKQLFRFGFVSTEPSRYTQRRTPSPFPLPNGERV